MKKLALFLIVMAVVAVALKHFISPPNPGEQRMTAQQSAHGVVEYWLTAIKDDREFDMFSVCHTAAQLQAKLAIEMLRGEEQRVHARCKATSSSPLSEPGKFTATLSSDKGTLMRLTLLAGEQDGKYWIFEVAQE